MMELGGMLKGWGHAVTREKGASPESFAGFSDLLDRLYDKVQRTLGIGGILEKGELLDARAALEDVESGIRASSDATVSHHLGALLGRVSGIRKTIEANLKAFEPDPDEKPDGALGATNIEEDLREAA